VDWFTDRHSFLLAVVLYGVSTVYSIFLWRKGFRRDDRVNYLLLLGAFAFHTFAMAQRGFSLNRCPVNNLFEAMMFFTWVTNLSYLLLGLFRRFRFVGAFAAPGLFAIGVFALMPSLDPPHGPKPEFGAALGSLHAALIMLAYGAFGLATVAAVMFLTQQHNLKFNKLRAVFSLLPPIQRLDVVTNRVVFAGFILLTLGLMAGGRLPRPEGVAYWQDTKVLWSAFLWLLYAGLLFSRMKFAFAGRRFAIGTVAVFVFMLLTFWGTNLLSTLHHP